MNPASAAPNVFMFPGQGAQYFQMGRELYERYPLFRNCLRELDQIVRELCGYSVLELLYERGYGKSETFDRTLLSHPAILMTQYATACVLIDAGIQPDLTLGTGVGSFAAAVVAEHLDIENALRAVIRQASMFEAGCVRGQAAPGEDRLHQEKRRPVTGFRTRREGP
jgi:acyl transferase domain-containing protein